MFDTPAPNFTVVNIGCKVNRVESDSIAAYLLASGGMSVEAAMADVIVVNSCTVTAEADKKTRKAVRSALRSNPRAEIVVTGCGVSVDADMFRSLDPRVETVERAELFSRFRSRGDRPLRIGDGFRTRVNVKVQDGCDHACTYCIVHVARGPARSAPFAEVVDEAEAYFKRGAKELVLTGIDLGSYHDGSTGLAELVEALLEVADKQNAGGGNAARIRVSSIEPRSVDERFVDVLAASEGRLCRHLHLPLQSGSSPVLKQMARPYTASYFEDLVAHLYRRVPRLSLTTDVICGFPGETDEDFEESLAVARRCRFSKMHVFPYSKRAGTPAASREDQVSDEVKAQRCNAMRSLSDELRSDDLARRSGSTELALVEPDCILTESYHEFRRHDESGVGQLVPFTFDYNGANG